MHNILYQLAQAHPHNVLHFLVDIAMYVALCTNERGLLIGMGTAYKTDLLFTALVNCKARMVSCQYDRFLCCSWSVIMTTES